MALVAGVAVLLGFRPTAGPGEWLAAFGLLALVSCAWAKRLYNRDPEA